MERYLMVHLYLAQLQRAAQLPERRDVRVSFGVLDRGLLRSGRLPFSDADRALEWDLVGHRYLSQHQHQRRQRPQCRDVRFGVRLLGRGRVLR